MMLPLRPPAVGISHMSRVGCMCTQTLFAVILAGSMLGSWGCDGDGGGGVIMPPPGIAASFTSSGTASAPDRVRFTAGSIQGDMAVVHVSIGGPTTSSDIYSFAFDVVLGSSSVATYVSGSATAGDALVPSAGQGVIVEAEASSQAPNRVVVGVTKSGGGLGNGVAAGEATIVRLTFRVLTRGTTTLSLEGAPGGQGPVALDSTGAVIGSIGFDAAPASLSGS